MIQIIFIELFMRVEDLTGIRTVRVPEAEGSSNASFLAEEFI
jgi:hypothetical protein